MINEYESKSNENEHEFLACENDQNNVTHQHSEVCCNLTEIKNRKKKEKREKNNLTCETYFNCNETKIKIFKKTKNKDTNTDTVFVEHEVNSGCKRKRGKKHEKMNFETDEVDICNETETNEKHKKKKKRKENSNLNEFYTPEHCVSDNDHLENSALSRSETYSDCGIIDENKTSSIIDSTNKPLEIYANPPEMSTEVEDISFSSDVHFFDDPVDFDIPPLHQFETVYRLTEEQKLILLTTDVSIKTGKFTPDEDSIIRRNFEDFVKKYNIVDPYLSLFKAGRSETNVMRFIKSKHFYVRLGKDLHNRSLNSIYKRARIILNPLKKSESLTENEVENLKKLNVKRPRKWVEIGDSVGYTPEKCAETFRWHEKQIAKGPFNKKERKQLIKAIKKVSESSDLSCKKIKGISWETVASYVPTRNPSQCRVYWSHNLAWAPHSERKKWDQECFRRLIIALKEQNVENPSSIDWEAVYEIFQDFAPSELFLQKRFFYLRSRVNDYAHKTFAEILNELSYKYHIYD